jgi:hypothetical protein
MKDALHTDTPEHRLAFEQNHRLAANFRRLQARLESPWSAHRLIRRIRLILHSLVPA